MDSTDFLASTSFSAVPDMMASPHFTSWVSTSLLQNRVNETLKCDEWIDSHKLEGQTDLKVEISM